MSLLSLLMSEATSLLFFSSEATNNHYWRSLSYLSYYLLIWTTGQEITSDCKDPIDIMIEFTGISLRHFVPFTFSYKKSSNKCCKWIFEGIQDLEVISFESGSLKLIFVTSFSLILSIFNPYMNQKRFFNSKVSLGSYAF